jgi:hypothetical protein
MELEGGDSGKHGSKILCSSNESGKTITTCNTTVIKTPIVAYFKVRFCFRLQRLGKLWKHVLRKACNQAETRPLELPNTNSDLHTYVCLVGRGQAQDVSR